MRCVNLLNIAIFNSERECNKGHYQYYRSGYRNIDNLMRNSELNYSKSKPRRLTLHGLDFYVLI